MIELKEEQQIDLLGYANRSMTNMKEKRVIAGLIADLIPERATLFADASTTAMEVLKLLANRDDLTVMTNSLAVLSSLNQSKLHIMSTGGVNNCLSQSLQGVIARNTLMNYHVDYVLTSCRGICLWEGCFDSREGETELKQLMISRGQKAIMLADHTKFDHPSFVKYCGFHQIDVLVTDKKPEGEWVEVFKEYNIRLIHPGADMSPL